MGHSVSGIITSFKYTGDLPFVYLIGNYALIPLDRYSKNFKGYAIEPSEELTNEIKKLAKNLSYSGKCAFIETSYHGGSGYQVAIVWDNGKRVYGPVISYDNLSEEYINRKLTIVEDAINDALKYIGILRHEGKDEFDTARLGWYNSVEAVINEYKTNAT